MATTTINLTDLAKNLTPMAVVGNGSTPKTGVSLAEMQAKGIPVQFIESMTKAGMNLIQVNAAWEASQQAKATPAAEPVKAHLTKEQSDATKRTFAAPVITKAAPANETPEQELARLKDEIAKLKASRSKIGMKVSEKGALSVYGLGKFPVTLYREQWERLLAVKDDIEMFILENESELKTKE